MKGQPDIIIANYHKEYTGLCIEFKIPTNNYQISEAQREMKSRYKQNGYRFLISNGYDHIITYLNQAHDGSAYSMRVLLQSILGKGNV